MKIVLYLSTFIFLLFAYFQFNDPDPLIWVSTYGFISALTVLTLTNKCSKVLLYISWIGYFFFALLYLPELFDWIRLGTPSIVGQMKAQTPYVEVTREFFGLVICIFAITLMINFKNQQVKRVDSH